MACGLIDLECRAGDAAEKMFGEAIESLARAIVEGVGKTVATLGTVWVRINTSNLTTAGPEKARSGVPDGSRELVQVLGMVKWIALVIAVISLFALGALIATRMRAGEGVAAVGKLGVVLGGVVIIAGAGSLAGGLMGTQAPASRGTVGFLQSSLWWYVGAGVVLSVIVGGARMVWEQRAAPGKELVRSLLTLVVVASAGVTVVGLLVRATDEFSVWIINRSLACDVVGDATCFEKNIGTLVPLAASASGLGAMLVIVLGLIAMLATVVQVVLMVARGGMLVVLTGLLPLAASATNTEMGRTWFTKCVSWLVAFILYKPAAAIIYATAFQLVGSPVFQSDGTGMLAVLTGLMLMVLALFAMPALMRFVTPMVGAMAAGAAGGAALAEAGMQAMPTGAAPSPGGGSPQGAAQTATGGGAPSNGPDGGGQNASAPRGSAGTGGSGPGAGGGASAGTGSSAGSAGSGAASAGGGAAAGGGSAAGGAAAGGAAAGGGAAAAGAAGGPVGMAAVVAADAAKKAGQAGMAAARSLGEHAAAEGGGPTGSQ